MIEEKVNSSKVTENKVVEEQPPAEQEQKRSVKFTFERLFNQIRDGLALSAGNETLKQYAGQFGYTPQRIDQGQVMFNETDTLYESQKRAFAAQLAATREFKEKKNAANITVGYLVQTVKLAFRDKPDTLKALGIDGTRQHAYGKWVAESQYFYNQALSIPGVLEELAKYNVVQADLEQGKQQLLDAIAAETKQTDAIAEAQKATELKTMAWKKLKKWWNGYIKVMTVALQDDRQMQEMLSIVTPSLE